MPHLLIGNINRPSQLAQGCTCHQEVFFPSDLVGSTNGKHVLLLLTPPAMLIRPFPYADIPKQHWNHMLASMKPVTSAVPKIQLAQSDNTEARVYGSKSEVWPYGLFPAGCMGVMVRLPCVYNSPPWVIIQLTINELANLWDFPLLLQEKLEELDAKSLLV